ncbi:MAG: HAMP domain-containing histidine kinase [Myxococcales bacterium]|nr:HAMP domain-containing histidine kinase [Myxococcales bacterium]
MGGITQLEAHGPTRVWARTWAMLAGVATLVFGVGAYLDQQSVDERGRVVAGAFADGTAMLMQKRIEAKVSSVRALTRDGGLRRFAEQETPELRAELEQRWGVLIEEDARLFQVRLLSATGHERLRVERRRGRVIATPVHELQDKSGRDYVEAGRRLKPGQLGLTAIELNREHGFVEVPWRPTFRALMPIHEANGLLLGLVVVNFDAEGLLSLVSAAPPGNHAALYSERGDCLSGCAPGTAFMGAFGVLPVLPQQQPEVWRWAEARASGEQIHGRKDYVLRSIPMSVGASRAASDSGFKLLIDFERAPLFSARSTALFVGVLVLLGLASWLWSRKVAAHGAAVASEERAVAQMYRAEKMAALGGIVAGVAHELNTPIGNALAVSSSLRDFVRDFEERIARGQVSRGELNEFLTDMQEGTKLQLRSLRRASELVFHFKRVAVDQAGEQRRQFSLHDCVDDIVEALRPKFKGTAVELRADYGIDATLDSYPGPLGQVLMNLIENARLHGFREDQHGVVRVMSKRIAGNLVEITVSDDGAGIPCESQSRVFEPFFTTRLAQGGSGLGLAIVHNLVTTLLGGTIGVSSGEETGTTFRVALPIVAPAVSTANNQHRMEKFNESPRAA